MTTALDHSPGTQGLVEIIDCAKYEDAIAQAHESLDEGGVVRMASIHSQGGRQHLVFSQPIKGLINLAKLDPATKADRANVEERSNRPINKEHVAGIVRYLAGNAIAGEPWILPALTFNARTPIKAFAFGKSSNRACFIPISRATEFFVTDGQHRLRAIQIIKQEMAEDAWPAIEDDYVTVSVVLEDDLTRIHQDFVDCSKVRKIEPSLLKTWDQQDPLARLSQELEEKSILFRDRVDKLSNQLAKDPNFVLTMSQLSFVAAEFVFGTSQKSRTTAASRHLRNDEDNFKRALRSACKFFEKFARANDAWRELIKDGATPDFYQLRLERIDFSSAGLQVVARAGHAIYTDPALSDAERDALVLKLASLDFRRKAEIWHRSIVSPIDYSLINKHATIDNAVTEVLAVIKYKPGPESRKNVWEP